MNGFPFGWMAAAGFFFLIAVIALMLFSWIECKMAYGLGEGEEEQFKVKISMLGGLVVYRSEGKKAELEIGPAKWRLKVTKPDIYYPKAEIKPEADRPTLLEKAKMILYDSKILAGWVKRVLARINIWDWHWNTTVGTGDAYWTSMATGAAWSAQTTILGTLSRLVQMKEMPIINVYPVFDDKAHFSTSWSCIAKIRFGHAILAGLHLMLRMKRVKGGFKAWQNILSKA